MACVITVAPAKGGWGVRREGGEPWVFESGAQAEWSARKLGEALADSGTAVEIHIVLRDGSLGGRFLCHPVTSVLGADRAWTRTVRTREPEPA